MNEPRYQGTDRTRLFAKEVRSRVHEHFRNAGISQKADGRMVPKVLAMLALFLLPLIVILLVPVPGWLALLLVITNGVGMAGIGMNVMHDGCHGSISERRWVNEWLGGSMYLLGSDVLTWKVQHNGNHHTHTNVDVIDQDIDPPDLLRFSEHAPRYRVQRFQHVYAFFFYGLLTFVKLFNDFFTLLRVARDPKHRVERLPLRFTAMVGVKALHVALFIGLPILFTPFTWWQVILGFLLMHFVAGVILGTVFQLAHVVEGAQQPLPDERGVIPTDWAVHELLTTADFAPHNRLVTWFTGGLNFQIEHHLFPYISHLHYPAIAPIVHRTALEHGLPYNVKPGMRKALLSHVRRLRELGR